VREIYTLIGDQIAMTATAIVMAVRDGHLRGESHLHPVVDIDSNVVSFVVRRELDRVNTRRRVAFSVIA